MRRRRQGVAAAAAGVADVAVPAPAAPMPDWVQAAAAAAVGICGCTGSIYAGFLYDDRALVVENDDLRPAAGWSQLLSNDYWGTPLDDPRSHTSWRPVTVASLKLNFHSVGLEPMPYHVTNVLLHSCVCALVPFAATAAAGVGESTRDLWLRGLLTGLVFAAHPIHSEAVDNVAGRAELLAALFALMSFVSFVGCTTKAAAGTGTGLQPRVAFSSACFLLATLSKETGFTVLGTMWAYDLLYCANVLPLLRALATCVQLQRQSGGNCSLGAVARRQLPLLLSAAAYCATRHSLSHAFVPQISARDNHIAVHPDHHVQVLSYASLHARYASLLLWPTSLSADYSFEAVPLVHSVGEPWVWAAIVLYLWLVLLIGYAVSVLVLGHTCASASTKFELSSAAAPLVSSRLHSATLVVTVTRRRA